MELCHFSGTKGVDGKTPVVVLSGIPGGVEGARRFHQDLAKHRPVIGVGLGEGHIPRNRGPDGWHAQSTTLCNLLTSAGLEHFHLVGLSYGGVWAQYVAQHAGTRVRSVSLVATTGRLRARERAIVEHLEAQLASSLPLPEILRGLMLLLLSPMWLAKPGAMMLVEHFSSRVKASRRDVSQRLEQLREHDLRALTWPKGLPAHVFAGTSDWLFPPQLSRELAKLTGATYRELDAGHLLWVERRESLAAAVATTFGA